jgi:hypothetical protein
MDQLFVRNLDDELVQAVHVRAASHGRSAEAEHQRFSLEAVSVPRSARSQHGRFEGACLRRGMRDRLAHALEREAGVRRS